MNSKRFKVSALPIGGGERVTGTLLFSNLLRPDNYGLTAERMNFPIIDGVDFHCIAIEIDSSSVAHIKVKPNRLEGQTSLCPNCNLNLRRFPSFCPNCGQALDWE